MNAAILVGIVTWAASTVLGPFPAQPQPQPPAQPVPQPAEPTAAEELRGEAEKLKPLVTSRLAASFLDATKTLTNPATRTFYRSADRQTVLTEEQMLALPEDQRAGYTKRECNARFYYYTGYGTPLMYARPLDLLAQKDPENWTPEKLPGKRIVDFGYGTIGHLRLLAALGADATGVDIDPFLAALYGFPGDQGEVPGASGKKGTVRALRGRWPAEEEIVKTVREGGTYDLFISKNTLKRGYIHPAREVDEKFLVKLGVEDDAYLKAVHDALKPGGVFLIYNLSPAQNPADQPYLPHADGQCPFPRELLEKTGFEVLEFDKDDQEGIIRFWTAIPIEEGKTPEVLKTQLFAWWTMCRKKP